MDKIKHAQVEQAVDKLEGDKRSFVEHEKIQGTFK